MIIVELDKAQKQFQRRIKCKCQCHIDYNNVFSFRDGIHCDECFIKNRDSLFK